MSDTAEKMLPTLLALPREDREMLYQHLGSSLDEQTDEESDEFAAMLNRRIEEMERDPSKVVSADDLFRKLREKYP
jgi:putative addiction module component (TIGR02574 family)